MNKRFSISLFAIASSIFFGNVSSAQDLITKDNIAPYTMQDFMKTTTPSNTVGSAAYGMCMQISMGSIDKTINEVNEGLNSPYSKDMYVDIISIMRDMGCLK